MRTFFWLVFILTLQILPFTNVSAQNSKLRYEKEPAWVTITKTDYKNKKFDGDAEDGYLDLAYEKQISLLQQSRYSIRSRVFTHSLKQSKTRRAFNKDFEIS
ncbi:MAG: hypothetical protein ABIO55_14050 [Ginsengibacter sp.]